MAPTAMTRSSDVDVARPSSSDAVTLIVADATGDSAIVRRTPTPWPSTAFTFSRDAVKE